MNKLSLSLLHVSRFSFLSNKTLSRMQTSLSLWIKISSFVTFTKCFVHTVFKRLFRQRCQQAQNMMERDRCCRGADMHRNMFHYCDRLSSFTPMPRGLAHVDASLPFSPNLSKWRLTRFGSPSRFMRSERTDISNLHPTSSLIIINLPTHETPLLLIKLRSFLLT